ncbi:Cupin domain protein [Chryseolinea serpens]|uniref:Cupin domain protein n=1 Tax=Chryseolinea serpens TaxID=947013 RepID=A0A1M5JRY0_9BACT|nr:carboxymuconolactone decarboxylase family protein [Chryseolinea serpens]SHG43316.1 Cupin domain protein [Chryseolinea serpens]
MRSAAITKIYLTIVFLWAPFLLSAQTSKPGDQPLTPRQQAIVMTAAFTANGDLDRLKSALHSALDAKLTINETKEVIVHVYAYAGFPRSIRGLQTLMAVLEERKASGIKDDVGKEVTPIPKGGDKYETGKKTLEKLTGRPQGELTGYNAFSPEIDRFLKEHLFADIFSRDLLTYAERELATVAALISIGGVEPMLSSHMRVAIRQGISENQLIEIISLLGESVGKTEIETARKVFGEISTTKLPPAAADTKDRELIFPKGQTGVNPNMTGTVWVYNLVRQDSVMTNSVGNVTFEPGARTHWHSHYAGQILLVTDGVGYHQLKGKPIEIIQKGDVIKCPPNVVHWHGASPTQSMTHVAITQNTETGRVVWLEKVTDEEYNAANKKQ